jgi:hypothetical protein
MPVEMKPPKFFIRRAQAAFALCAGLLLVPAARAQQPAQTGESRFLFIFDTSADMKKRLPAVQTEVNQLLATSLSGQLRASDSIGVWTFDQNLRSGQFPLQHWLPEDAVTIASDINQFVGKQRFANGTRFDALQPLLNEVIKGSERLTVLIFSDGEDQIQWTPFNAGINQVVQQRLAEQKKTKQPFVLVLRTQLGQYVGCTVNFPPGMVNVPEFPPLPAPVQTPPPAPPPAPVVNPPPPIGPPLIIIGTKVETNWPPAPAPTLPTNPAPVTPTNIVPVVPAAPATLVAPTPTSPAPEIQTNAAPAPVATPAPPANPAPMTPAKLVPVPPPKPTTAANPVAASPENSSPARKGALAIGALLIAAGALAALAFFRGRRTDRGSLISRAMRKD